MNLISQVSMPFNVNTIGHNIIDLKKLINSMVSNIVQISRAIAIETADFKRYIIFILIN